MSFPGNVSGICNVKSPIGYSHDHYNPTTTLQEQFNSSHQFNHINKSTQFPPYFVVRHVNESEIYDADLDVPDTNESMLRSLSRISQLEDNVFLRLARPKSANCDRDHAFDDGELNLASFVYKQIVH